MPAAVRFGDRIVVAMRRRGIGKRDGWIDAYGSDDDGATWRFLSLVTGTGNHNGNPPALIAADNALVCCYANRSDYNVCARTSNDGGQTWSDAIVVRQSTQSDIGYPRLFLRADGVPICVYYWADADRPHQHIAATTLEGVL